MSSQNIEPVAPTTKKPKKHDRQLRVNFTNAELLEKGRKIAETHHELAPVENEFDSVKAQFKSKLERLNTTVGELANHMTAGWEYRNVACETRYDDPAPGKKTTRRMDVGDVIDVEDMTNFDRQSELPLGDDKKAGVDGSGVVKVDADK